MKIKSLAAIFTISLGIVFIGSLNADAGTWATAIIDNIGVNGIQNRTSAQLTHDDDSPVFEEKWFLFDTDMENQMLATALTAKSLGKKLRIYIANDGVTIDACYVYDPK
jgi:hypothetical protein